MPCSIEPSALEHNRLDLADLCNRRGLKRAVEVGTDRGIFARDFLELWHGEMLVCVDHWQAYNEMERNREGDFAMAVAVLAPYARRCRILRARSPDVIPTLAPWRPNFVYIDGDHSREGVERDIHAWWDALDTPGVLAGHDWGTNEHPGVTEAVKAFAIKHKLLVRITRDAPASWWVAKEPPEK